MQHKGEIIEKAVRQSGYPITKLAKKLRKSRRWMYHVFENSNVSIDYVLKIGEVIHHDFSDEIKELKKYKKATDVTEVREPEATYNTKQKEIENWKDKYLKLLEKYNDLLVKWNDRQKLKIKKG